MKIVMWFNHQLSVPQDLHLSLTNVCFDDKPIKWRLDGETNLTKGELKKYAG